MGSIVKEEVVSEDEVLSEYDDQDDNQDNNEDSE